MVKPGVSDKLRAKYKHSEGFLCKHLSISAVTLHLVTQSKVTLAD